jgi:poly-gamma-glutamate synthesis protein (capsule biosynthesis protein)
MSLFSIALAVSIVFTGDILLDRGVRDVVERRGVDQLFSKDVDAVLHQSQVVVGNLECPATKIKAPVFKRYVFRAEPEWLWPLAKHGFTHLNLANNHSIDQGRQGLMDTRRQILKAGMTPVGAGATMAEAVQPVLLTRTPRHVWLVASLRLALENYAYLPSQPCVSQEPMDSLLRRVRRLRQTDPEAVIVVSLHWGGEHTLQPVPRQRLEAHRLIEAGADVLVCHHTHTLQTVEDYRGHKIYYSIGNFIFDQQRRLNSEACMVRLLVGRQRLDVETLPVTIRRCTPYLLNLKDYGLSVNHR